MRGRVIMTVFASAALMVGCGSSPQPPTARLASYIRSQNPSRASVVFLLDAGLGSDNGGFNFDGASQGGVTYTVPVGWHVAIQVHNSGSVPSSAVVAKNSQSVAPIFPGASTPSPLVGMAAGQTQTLRFLARHAGHYAIVCAVPGHAPEGMWIRLVVSKTATAASVSH